MTIRALDFVLQDRKLIREAPLSVLRDARLGIDAQVYTRRLLSSPETKEAFVPALGGVPLGLEDHIVHDLRALQLYNIKPIFCFPGLVPPRRERPLSTPDSRPAQRQAAWEHYEKGRNDAAISAFGSVPMQPADVFRVIHRCFLHRKTEYVVAPYLSWAQLVYLERSPKQYVHATWSSTEFLLFEGVDRLILNIDFKASTFTFVSKRDLLNELSLGTEQFLDLGILAGFDSAPSIPLQEWSFKAILDLVKRCNTGMSVITTASVDNPAIAQTGYSETFCRAKAMVRYSLVCTSDEGKVQPLPLALPNPSNPTSLADIPQDLHEVFSHRLPDEVYFQLFRGLISPNVIGPLTSGVWVEQAPLCGGESDEYRRFLRDIITEHPQSPRCVALGLLAACLNPFWQQRPVSAIYWFDPSSDHRIAHTQQSKIVERLALWNVPSAVIEEELRRQHSSTIDLRLCLGATAAAPTLAARTKVSKNPDKLLEKKDEIVANTLWRFLELRGFVSSSHTPTNHGKALHRALEASRINDRFQEPLYLAMELLRAGVLHAGKYGGKTWSGGPNLGGEKDKTNALLVMRVVSIVGLTCRSEAWTGPVSRSLLVFNSFLRTLSRSMRALLEAVTLNLLLNGDARRSRDDYLEIALSLPFRMDTSTGMGVVWKGWCDACAMVGVQSQLGTREELGGFTASAAEGMSDEEQVERKENLEEVKKAVSEMLEEGFKSVKDVRAELARGVRFWDALMVAIRTLQEERSGLHPELYQSFEDADKWLEPFRP